ncbi:hypothetical protein JCM8547_006915 [Rhodosporidiobolus lusitaniae]
MDIVDPQECVVCRRASADRCSGCDLTVFCSTDCQRLAWQCHKIFCSADGQFIHPSLTSQEAFFLKLDEPYVEEDWAETILERLRRCQLYQGTFPDLLAQMQLERSRCPIPEPRRTAILIMLRARIANPVPILPPSGPPTCWQRSANRIIPLLLDTFLPVGWFANKRQPRDPTLFARAGEYMKQHVLEAALEIAQAKGMCDGETLHRARERTKAMMDTLGMRAELAVQQRTMLKQAKICRGSIAKSCVRCASGSSAASSLSL